MKKSHLKLSTALLTIVLITGMPLGKARAQSTPGLTQGQVPTAGQWNSFFAQKQDFLGVPPLLSSGGALSGKLTLSASIASTAEFNLGQGATPTAPINGDMWITPAGLFIQVAGVTQGPMLSTGGGGFLGQSNLWTAANTFGSQAPGNGALKWNPLFFGVTANGVVTRINRLFIGEAMSSSSDLGPVTTKDWSETLVANTIGVAQLGVVDDTGTLAIYGASRSSDYRTTFALATGGAQGVTGLGYNNDTGAGSPIATGMNGIGVRASGVGGISLGNQSDMNNGGSVVDVEPFTGFTAGTTVAQLATPGAYSVATANVSALYVAGLGRMGGPVARKGYVTLSGALDTSIGAGGGGIAFDSYRGQSMRWRNSGLTTDTEMWGNASGLNINSAVSVTGALTLSTPLSIANGGTNDTGTAWGTYTPSVTCGNSTWVVESARFKTLGKTVFVELDLLNGTIGNCSGTGGFAVNITLPVATHGNAILNGSEIDNSGNFVTCEVVGGVSTSTATCFKGGTFTTDWLVADRILVEGVYESN